MPQWFCCVPGCNAAKIKFANPTKYPWMDGVTFHPLPASNIKNNAPIRKKWLELIRRKNFEPTRYTRVCSRHWKGGEGPTQEDPYPTLFPYNHWGKSKKPRLQSKWSAQKDEERRAEATAAAKRRGVKRKLIPTATVPPSQSRQTSFPEVGNWVDIETTDSEVPRKKQKCHPRPAKQPRMTGNIEYSIPAPLADHCYARECQLTEDLDNVKVSCRRTHTSDPEEPIPEYSAASTQTTLRSPHIDCIANDFCALREKSKELQRLLDEAKAAAEKAEDNLKKEKANGPKEHLMNRILSSDKECMKYTGVPTLDKLNGLLQVVDNNYPKIKYWKGEKSAKEMGYETNEMRKKPGPARSLTRKEEMILTLVRLRTGMTVWLLADMFSVSETRVTEIFHTWIVILATVTMPLRQWPDKEQIRRRMPRKLRRDYPKTTVIIDCSEFYIQRPSNPTAQVKTYSSYKSHNTYKCLLGISPTGAFTYVSDLFGGNASDKYIVEHSDFLEHIQHGDDVMADRGFTIRSLLAQRGATLNMPPFTRKAKYGKGKRLNNKEIWTTRKIAHHRIHVERAIQRLKLFRLLTCVMPSSLQDAADECVQVAAALCNLQKPLVKP